MKAQSQSDAQCRPLQEFDGDFIGPVRRRCRSECCGLCRCQCCPPAVGDHMGDADSGRIADTYME
jgi:hypothetical protein